MLSERDGKWVSWYVAINDYPKLPEEHGLDIEAIFGIWRVVLHINLWPSTDGSWPWFGWSRFHATQSYFNGFSVFLFGRLEVAIGVRWACDDGKTLDQIRRGE